MSAFDDYLNAGQPQGRAQGFDSYLGDQQAPAQQAAPSAVPPVMRAPKTQADPSAWDQLTRQIGLTARAGVTGVTGIPTMLGDALNTGLNYGIRAINSAHDAVVPPTVSELVTGRKPWIPELQMPSQAVQQGMNAVGLPQPQNATERVVQDVASSMADVSPGVGVGRALARATVPAAMGIGNAPAPVVNAVGRGLASLPGMQVFGAAGSAAGSGIARENGAGPLGQIGSGLLGGVAGAVLPSAALGTARAIRAIPDNVRGVVQPFTNPGAYVGNQLANRLAPDAQAIAENIRNAPEFVPGSAPTTAQVGANPTLVATEKALANSSPDFKIGLATREAANNQARWDALGQIAQTPLDLKNAIANRDTAVNTLYNTAKQQNFPVDAPLTQIMNRPAMRSAMAQAQKLSDDKSAGPILRTIGMPNSVYGMPQAPQAITGNGAHYIKMAIDDMLDPRSNSGFVGNSQGALRDTRAAFMSWLESHSPEYAQARQTFSDMSPPINTMQAAQAIQDKLSGLGRALNTSGTPLITAPGYASAMTHAIESQPFGIQPQAQTALENIGRDLQRSTISNSMRSPGSDTAYNIASTGWLGKQLYGSNFEGGGNAARGVGALGALVTGHPMVAGGILMGGKKLGGMAADRLNASLGELMLDPQKLLPYLEAVKPSANGALPALPLGSYINQGLLGSSVTQRPRP